MHKLISFVVLLGLFSIAFEAGADCTAGSPNASAAEATPTGAFTDNGDGTVTHSLTGLMWKQCVEGTSGAACATGSAATYTWSQALLQAKNSTYAAHTDWRLPNKKELQSIVETCTSNPAINQVIFPATPASGFWSGSSYVAIPTDAWLVNFYVGSSYANANSKANYSYVRLVRGGQSFDSFALPVSTIAGEPTIGTAIGGNAQAKVTFSAPTSTGGSVITGYTVISSPAGGIDINAGSTDLSHVIMGLTNGTAYTFTVKATNAAGTGTASASSNSVTPATVPGVPTIGIATGGNAQATVTFSAPASTGGSAITGYTVISSPAGGIDSNAGSTDLSHVITGLTNGTAYTFTVTATNALGTGVASASSNLITPLPGLSGKVVDLGTGLPIPTVIVTLTGGLTTQTDINGNYQFAGVNLGGVTVSFTKTGYATLSLPSVLMTAQGIALNVQMTLPGQLNFTNLTLLPAYPGVAYSDSARATGGVWPYVFNVVGTLPAGLTLNTSNGVISGTPTTAGSSTFAIGVTDSTPPASGGSVYAEVQYTLVVTQPLAISNPTALPRGTLGTNYFQSILPTGGTQPYTFALAAGVLPAGVTLVNGNLTGTPTTLGVSQFTIKVTDAASRTITQNFTLQMVSPLVISTARLNNGIVGTAYNMPLTATGGFGTYTWAVYSGTLPTGLALDPLTGLITGTVTAATFGVVVFSVTDVDGRITYKDLSLNISRPLTILNTAIPKALQNAPYSEAIRLDGGVEPYSFSVPVGGVLPAGLQLNASTGVISGTPTGAVLTNFQVSVVDSTWPTTQTVTKTFSLRVDSVLTVTTSAVLPNEMKNVAINPIVMVAQGSTAVPFIWAVTAGYMPQGITLDTATGQLTGTPQGRGDFQFTLQVTDKLGNIATKQFFWYISDTLTISTGALKTAFRGVAYSEMVVAAGGALPYNYSVSLGALPAGLTLNSISGALSGTTYLPPGFSSTFKIKVVDSGNPSGFIEKSLVINVVDPLVITTTVIQDAHQGSAYVANMAAVGGFSPYTWSVSAGTLPAGMTIDPVTGALAGTPTTCGSFNFTVGLTDAAPLPDTTLQAFNLNVSCAIGIPGAPTIGTATGGNRQATVSFTAPANTGGSAITGYTVISTPAGGVDSNVGSTGLSHVITGLTNGTAYTFKVTATNAVGTGVASASSNLVTPNIVGAASFTVSASAGANGSIAPASQIVASGNTASLTVTPNTGYTADVSGCSGTLNGEIYTTAAIVADCSVSATFTVIPNANQWSLIPGWNLLGNSVEAALDVTTTFNDSNKVITVWKWIAVNSKWDFYTPSMNSTDLYNYATSKGYGVLSLVNGGEGFWVNAKSTFTVPLPSGVAVQSASFKPATVTPASFGGTHALLHGWSLIATGDLPTPTIFDAAIATVPSVAPSAGNVYANLTSLWAWDAVYSNWYFWAPSLVNSGGLAGYILNKKYLDFSTMPNGALSPVSGFWVNMPP